MQPWLATIDVVPFDVDIMRGDVVQKNQMQMIPTLLGNME